jgi:hypothetical protein
MSDQPSLYNTSEDSPIVAEAAEEEEQEQDQQQQQVLKPEIKADVKPVFKTVTAWQKYYDDMGVVRQKIVAELSKRQEYEIQLDPVYEGAKLVQPDEIKVYKRAKVSTRDFFEHERMRAAMQNSKERDPMKIRDAMIELYKKLATDYLLDKETQKPMSENDFWRCKWAFIKAVLDACNLHSVLGSVPLDQTISGV